jgi:hypothetical protein
MANVTLQAAHAGLLEQANRLRARIERLAKAEDEAEADTVHAVRQGAAHVRDLVAKFKATAEPGKVFPLLADLQEQASGLTATLAKLSENAEKRVARLLRASSAIEAAMRQEGQRAKRLAKSRRPQDRAELVLGALDELPLDVAEDVLKGAKKRLKDRATTRST